MNDCMKTHELKLEFQEFIFSDLDQPIQNLFEAASAQLEHSYAPYSNFNVGAAVSLENGEICTGCNQENSSYPLCLCGERVALFHAGTRYPSVGITALVITCRNNKKQLEKPVSPCGACRQVISEFTDKQKKAFPIYLKVDGKDIIYKFKDIGPLLPFSFSSAYL